MGVAMDGARRPPRSSQSRRYLLVPSLVNKKLGMRNADGYEGQTPTGGGWNVKNEEEEPEGDYAHGDSGGSPQDHYHFRLGFLPCQKIRMHVLTMR